MDKSTKGSVCPLLKDPDSYNPDSIDLIHNLDERNYWLPCLENMVKNFVNKAHRLNPDDPQAEARAELCLQKFHNLVTKARDDHRVLVPLSIRTLLEFNEDNLRSNNFKDAWLSQKKLETEAALRQFPARLAQIDSIPEFDRRWLEVITGVLAGNVFDWGSKAVADILEKNTDFGLDNAKGTIEQRPWFRDDLDCWLRRIQSEPYKEAVIFVDNAGMDFVLGVVPLAREFLKMGTKVILSANSSPALNDVTFRELKLYTRQAGRFCPVVEKALENGGLVCVENGQKGPCLDLNNLPPALCKLMTTADLVVLEGMARAVHTNLYAKFKVDCLKMAVLKNEWLAKSLGGRHFSIIFRYDPAD